jgi:hypothetical protein
MTEFDRLIKLFNKDECPVTFVDHRDERTLAEHLLLNGVIVPPCKVGEELYCVYSPPHPANPADKGKWYMNKFEVARFHYGVKGLSIEMYGYGTVNENEIGKTVFLNRGEAEQALAERREKND